MAENTNCLEGFKCPECKSLAPFDIAGTTLFLAVTDDGTSEYSDVEWTHNSFCRCCTCGHEATVVEFNRDFPVPCKKCGSDLTKAGYCKDETCPFSDRTQDETYSEG